jgi:LytS/YehU family sensor histidine kinase
VLQAQIEPHFLFNTLANVQALVESGSPQAGPVLKSLIAYLRAAVPKLHTRRRRSPSRCRWRAPTSS